MIASAAGQNIATCTKTMVEERGAAAGTNDGGGDGESAQRCLHDVLTDPNLNWSDLRQALKDQKVCTHAGLAQALKSNAVMPGPRPGPSLKKKKSKDDLLVDYSSMKKPSTTKGEANASWGDGGGGGPPRRMGTMDMLKNTGTAMRRRVTINTFHRPTVQKPRSFLSSDADGGADNRPAIRRQSRDDLDAMQIAKMLDSEDYLSDEDDDVDDDGFLDWGHNVKKDTINDGGDNSEEAGRRGSDDGEEQDQGVALSQGRDVDEREEPQPAEEATPPPLPPPHAGGFLNRRRSSVVSSDGSEGLDLIKTKLSRAAHSLTGVRGEPQQSATKPGIAGKPGIAIDTLRMAILDEAAGSGRAARMAVVCGGKDGSKQGAVASASRVSDEVRGAVKDHLGHRQQLGSGSGGGKSRKPSKGGRRLSIFNKDRDEKKRRGSGGGGDSSSRTSPPRIRSRRKSSFDDSDSDDDHDNGRMEPQEAPTATSARDHDPDADESPAPPPPLPVPIVEKYAQKDREMAEYRNRLTRKSTDGLNLSATEFNVLLELDISSDEDN